VEQLAPLGINLGLLFVQVVNFLIILLILWALLYKPLLNMLKQRSERIGEGLNNARRADEALASAEADRQKILDEARAEAQRITAEARTRADEAAAKIKADAQAEAKRIGELARVEAGTEKDRVMADVRDQIVSLSLAAANHLIGKNLDEKKQREYVQDFFTGLPKAAKKLSGDVTVITAVPLKTDEQKKFQKELGVKDIAFKVDPSILGGVIVRAGGEQIDGSFANQLSALRTSLS
jgi:F-type H+-transporting ATPase subunit b